jgi:hypothetical protein
MIRKYKINEALQRKKTFMPLALLVIHQSLRSSGMDVFSDEQISLFVDILLALIAALLKYIGNRRELKSLNLCKEQIKTLQAKAQQE